MYIFIIYSLRLSCRNFTYSKNCSQLNRLAHDGLFISLIPFSSLPLRILVTSTSLLQILPPLHPRPTIKYLFVPQFYFI